MVAAGNADAASVLLVTPQEMTASNEAPASFTAKFAPEKDAPKIELTAPNIAAPLASPTPIQLVFASALPATIKPESFKVLYGTFQIDITQRLVNAAKITAEGISVKEASLPKGRHRLLLSIEDQQGRQGMKSVDFDIN